MTICDNYIPDDVIVEILLKLPAKYVLRFKSVCKTWHSLISDPVFINLHSKRSPQNPKVLYAACDDSSKSRLQLFDYGSSSFDVCCLYEPIKFPNCGFSKIVGSSHGLVCVATSWLGSNFFIWNPLTRHCREIPTNPKVVVKNRFKLSFYLRGLGYDPVGKDFKLVTSMDRIRYNIFSLKANSWKQITCPFAPEYSHPNAIQDEDAIREVGNFPAVVLNGIFHWVVKPRNKEDLEEIVAFDAGKETFQKMQLPHHNICIGPTLLQHAGCLCVSFLTYHGMDDERM